MYFRIERDSLADVTAGSGVHAKVVLYIAPVGDEDTANGVPQGFVVVGGVRGETWLEAVSNCRKKMAALRHSDNAIRKPKTKSDPVGRILRRMYEK